MSSDSFIITGAVSVEITITELADGSLQFDLNVLTENGTIGDLNAIYFDLFDDSLTNTLSVTGDDVTGAAFKKDGVTKVDSYTNMNGGVIKDLGKFDGGVQFGSQGIGSDDIQTTSFILSTTDANGLSLSDFSLQDFGLRLTSVGDVDGSRDGSVKLGGNAGELEGENPEPVCDDTMTVTEDEISAPPFLGAPTDQLDTFEFSLLANNPDANAITSVQGGDVGQVVLGSNGGFIVINADGTFDFDAAADFQSLNDGDVSTTDFTYTMDNGLEATLCVTVTGITDGPGGPGGEN